MNQNLIKFDNKNFNKLLAYTSIINSLNYKWYKSSKRRVLLPNFYFTRSFYNFYNVFCFKNIFRKKIQSNRKYSLYNPIGFFEKKMFLKHVNIVDLIKTSDSDSFFFKNKYISFLEKDKFFFKIPNNLFLENFSLFVSKDVDTDFDLSLKLHFFKKSTTMLFADSVDFNVLIFFFLTSSSLIEIYKISIYLYLNQIVLSKKIIFNFSKEI
jgi:hypothetical protein